MATAPVAVDDLLPAELGKPLRKRWGRMTPLCTCGGRQWLLAPMWMMNILTLALILVPGFLWFRGVWHRRTWLEQWFVAPGLFAGTLLAYAFTSWVDPGIVQPGRFAQLEDALRQGATSTATRGGEALETPDELRTRWSYRGHQRGEHRIMVTPDGVSMPVCAICGVPQPMEHQVVHVSCVAAFDAQLALRHHLTRVSFAEKLEHVWRAMTTFARG